MAKAQEMDYSMVITGTNSYAENRDAEDITLRLIDAHAPQLLLDGKGEYSKTELINIAQKMMQQVSVGDIRMFIEDMLRDYGTIVDITSCECGAPIMIYEYKV